MKEISATAFIKNPTADNVMSVVSRTTRPEDLKQKIADLFERNNIWWGKRYANTKICVFCFPVKSFGWHSQKFKLCATVQQMFVTYLAFPSWSPVVVNSVTFKSGDSITFGKAQCSKCIVVIAQNCSEQGAALLQRLFCVFAFCVQFKRKRRPAIGATWLVYIFTLCPLLTLSPTGIIWGNLLSIPAWVIATLQETKKLSFAWRFVNSILSCLIKKGYSLAN